MNIMQEVGLITLEQWRRHVPKLPCCMVGHMAEKVCCLAIVETTEARVERLLNDQESRCVLQQYTVFRR